MSESPAAARVSVVLPLYNGERYLQESIDSVLAQDYTDFELLICDDASRDGSIAIVERYHDPRIQLLRNEPNRGLFFTLNRLIKASRGALIRLWAQDDRMYPSCLGAQVRFHEQHPQAMMSYCDFHRMNDRSEIDRTIKLDTTPALMSPALASEIMFFHGSISGNIANVMLDRSVFDAVGMFREDMRVAADFEMWVRIAGDHWIGRLDQPLMALRGHGGQFSRRRGILPTFIKENAPIFETLHARLPPNMRDYGRRYLRRHVHVQYAHHALRSIASGDLSTALRTFEELRKVDRPLPTFAWWLLTGNGRWLTLPPRAIARAGDGGGR